VVKAPKKHPGQRFEGLNMLTEMLRPRGAARVSGLQKVQLLEDNSGGCAGDEPPDDADADNADAAADDDDVDDEWFYEQESTSRNYFGQTFFSNKYESLNM
jgi:hypothetical protein